MVNRSGGAVPATALGPRHARPSPSQMSRQRRAVLHVLIAANGAVTVAALAEQLGQHPNTIREHLDGLVAADRAERLHSRPLGRGRPAWLYRAVGPAEARSGTPGGDGHPRTATAAGAEGTAGAARTEVTDGPAGTEVTDGAGGYDGMDVAAAAADGGGEYVSLALALIDEVGHSNPDPRAVARHAGERWGRTLAARRAGAGRSAKAATPRGIVLDMLAGLRFEPEPAPRPGVVRLTTCPLLDAARRNPDLVCQVHLGIVRGALERVGGDPDGVDLEPFAEPGACLLTLPGRR